MQSCEIENHEEKNARKLWNRMIEKILNWKLHKNIFYTCEDFINIKSLLIINANNLSNLLICRCIAFSVLLIFNLMLYLT